eukprot:CAMPEP_0178958010 /NCGR_PEP_ID=MMETSP0789-20121207/11304_1 /TAXON_ID=3005 /ORGANISM="Rhizosolenia setigera, Strain CCMP 1694" /LENGTH=259 /DNA_ID=CAMNT_0020640467 /DNA_START=290 /DNA_END=1069 /DNA_ORIENTATION=+
MINKHCKEVYLNTPGMKKETFLFGYAPLAVIQDRCERVHEDGLEEVGKGVLFYNRKDILDWALEEQKNYVLREICFVAVEEERLDLLNEVWNNMNDEDNEDEENIFEEMDEYAAAGGKLNVLMWFENNVLCIDEHMCAESAARYGHIHIIQWLQEEKGFELYGFLYDKAIDVNWEIGGQLRVLKWLREQEVPWDDYSFRVAAQRAADEGNLNVLQWLHDEGCPWPQYNSIPEYCLNPEIVEWLRLNGYGNRIVSDSDDD